MPVKKHSVEQIIAKLREVEKLTGQSMSIRMAAKRVGVIAGGPGTARSRRRKPNACSCSNRTLEDEPDPKLRESLASATASE